MTQRGRAFKDQVSYLSCLRRGGCVSLLALAILFGNNSSADCQSPESSTPASISGYVSDVTGAVIPDAVVSLISEAASGSPEPTVAQIRTDNQGRFKVDAMRGAYVLNIRSNGFRQLTRQVKIEDAQQALAGVQLEIAGGSSVCTLPCSWPPPFEVLMDNKSLSSLIEPVPIPQFQQPARRLNRRRWTWPI